MTLQEYVTHVRAQSVRNAEVRPQDVERALNHLVLSPAMVKQLGTAVISGTSIVLYGPTGTGKTTLAEAVTNIYHEEVWIPYALEIDGQILTVYDPIVHKRLEKPLAENADRRWVLCGRPCVMVGGELTIEMLDLQFNPVSKYYSAPVQMKANNGLLIVDDFGRQRIRPEELLNRWTVPLDRRKDFLTLSGGRKLEMAFDLLVVFATNLDPAALADEAFLRRIHNKIRVDAMTAEQFQEVLRRLAARFKIPYEPAMAGMLIDMLRQDWKQPLRACYAFDVVAQIRWAAQYEGRPAEITRDALAQACRNYFLTPTPAATL